MTHDIFDDAPETLPEPAAIGDQTLLPEMGGTSLAEPVVDEVATTLTPLIERAAHACDSLRDAVANATPAEMILRGTLDQITELLERADQLVPGLEARTMTTAITADESATTGTDDVRAMIDTAVENLGTRCQMQLDLVRTEIDALAREMGSKIDALSARIEEIATASAPAPTPTAHPAIEDSLGEWETHVAELLRLFREKAEHAMASVDEIGRRQVESLDALCARAERLMNSPGREAGTIVEVLDDVVHTIEPWRGLLVEGKCGADLSPAIAAIVDRVRAEVQGDIGRLGDTVSQVVAITSRLAESTDAPAASASTATVAAAKPKPRAIATARPKAKAPASKAKSGR